MNQLLTIALIFFLSLQISQAQKSQINPDGYNIFYYENGKISSEGYMKAGKPEGYWKTYYPSGILKSEGNRKNFLLDSTWVFYDEQADTLEKINYREGKKNGYFSTWKYEIKDRQKKGGLVSKELYLNDIKQGTSIYYENGLPDKSIPYKDGKKHGLSREFDINGNIVAIAEYSNDYLVIRERINRYDKNGLKQGTWKTFHPNDRLHTDAYYVNDSLSGYFKEYDMTGKLLKVEKYYAGKLLAESEASGNNGFKDVEDFYENGKIKFRGSYKDSLPVGMHKEYSVDGTVVQGKEYNDSGLVIAEGQLDENDKKQGAWKYYYETGELQATGAFKNDLKTGEWIFYYTDGQVEQKGKYVSGKPSGTWIWYYPKGTVWREENMSKGKEEGSFVEYDPQGNIILRGEYLDGEREGTWFYKTGDNTEEGNYQAGLREGYWKHYHANGKLSYEGNWVQGVPDGKHKWYFENGRIREDGFYSMGVKEKNWNKFDLEGYVYLTITYRNDKEYRINGVKLRLPKGAGEE